MKKLTQSVAIILVLFSLNVHAQDISWAQRWIKVGNSLREAEQFEQAENYLLKGLSATRNLKNKYWEAVACENLGLLYVNTDDKIKAGQYFNVSLGIYKDLKMTISTKVVADLMSNYGITQDNVWQLYGGIEVGAKGVKFTVIKVGRLNGSFHFISVKDGSKNPQTIDFTDKSNSETAAIVKSFLDTLMQSKVNIDNIYIEVSSGVKQEADKKPGTEKHLTDLLTAAVPGYTKKIHFLDPCEEGDLTIRGALPKKVLFTSSLIDIGSGNTKGGFRERDQPVSECISIPWGSVTFAKKFATKANKVAYAQQFFKDSIGDAITSEIQKNNDLVNKKYAYFTGGIIWAMSNYLHPESIKNDISDFSKEDVDKLLDLAVNNYQALINPDLTRISDPNQVKAAEKEIASSRKIFNQDNIIAGAMVLKGIMDQLEKGYSNHDDKKEYLFIRYGSVGWISGYIVKNLDNSYKNLSE